MVRTLAQLTGHKLIEFPLSSDTDTMDIVGSFQQVCNDYYCRLKYVMRCRY